MPSRGSHNELAILRFAWIEIALQANRDGGTNHEKTQHRWNSRWSRVLDLGAVVASVVAKQCGAIS